MLDVVVLVRCVSSVWVVFSPVNLYELVLAPCDAFSLLWSVPWEVTWCCFLTMNASSVSYSLLSWNVRGLGEKDKCMIVRDTLTIARANIVCLQETKLRATDKLKSCAFLPMTLNEFRCVDSADTHGSMSPPGTLTRSP